MFGCIFENAKKSFSSVCFIAKWKKFPNFTTNQIQATTTRSSENQPTATPPTTQTTTRSAHTKPRTQPPLWPTHKPNTHRNPATHHSPHTNPATTVNPAMNQPPIATHKRPSHPPQPTNPATCLPQPKNHPKKEENLWRSNQDSVGEATYGRGGAGSDEWIGGRWWVGRWWLSVLVCGKSKECLVCGKSKEWERGERESCVRERKCKM